MLISHIICLLNFLKRLCSHIEIRTKPIMDFLSSGPGNLYNI